MTAPFINAFEFAHMECVLQLPLVVSEFPEPTPGTWGVVIRRAGRRASPVEITTVTQCSSAADLAAAKANYSNLTGSLVVIGDPIGNTFSNVYVISVSFVEEKAVNNFIGGLYSIYGTTHLLRCVWSVIYPYGVA